MSSTQSTAHRYREVSVKTANPIQLVVMLYDAAICSLREAREHMDQKHIEARSQAINKSISIISELHSCLNLKAGGEIADSLDRLYDYMKRRIFRANADQNTEPLEEIEALLESLRSAWCQILDQTQSDSGHSSNQQLPNPGVINSKTSSQESNKPFNISA